MTREAELLGQKPVPALLFLPQISFTFAWVWRKAHAASGQRLCLIH